MRLTDLSIKALKAPEKGAIIYPDDVLTGFGVRVSQAGTKSFVLTHGVRRQRETIGRVGVIALAEARSQAKRRLAEYTLGKEKPPAVSWDAALGQYLTELKGRRKESTYLEYTRVLKRHFRFGQTKLPELSQRDLDQKLDRLATTPSEQQHAFVVLRVFLNWCYRRSYVDQHPMQRMKAPHKYNPRERVLTNEELTRVWIALGDNTFDRIVKLLILTGQREGEIANLTRDMRGDGTLTLPPWLTKNKREHTFPLGAMAATLLPDRAGLLFPARGKPDHPFSGFSNSKGALDKAANVRGWRLHDLRRTFATGMASIGVALPVVEKLLNHVSGSFAGIVAVYQRHDYWEEMREAVEKWEAHVQALVAHGRQPTGHRDVSGNGGRDAALIEEASA